MSAAHTIRLVVDAGPFKAHLDDQLSALHALVEAGDHPAERLAALGDRILNLLDGGAAVDLEVLPAAAAGECRVVLKPAERLCLGLAAMRAGDVERCLEIYGHEESSSGLVGTATVGESGRAGD